MAKETSLKTVTAFGSGREIRHYLIHGFSNFQTEKSCLQMKFYVESPICKR